MSEFLRAYRARVEKMLEPLRRIYGEEAPTVRMAYVLLSEAEEVEDYLRKRRVSTMEAVDHTGWSYDTLQRYAKIATEGAEELPKRWSGLAVERTGTGYSFILETIPRKS